MDKIDVARFACEPDVDLEVKANLGQHRLSLLMGNVSIDYTG